jgi:heat shock protein HslJ
MTLKRALMVLVLGAFAALSGCGDDGGDRDLGASVDPGLGPITYVVTRVTVGGTPHVLVRGTEIRLRFGSGQVTLTAGCNTMTGNYALEESRLTVEPLATTEMGCDQPRMEQDTWLAGLFEKPVQFTSGDDATIVSGDTVLALADREKLSPDRPLVGTRWNLDTLIDGDVASSVPSGHSASLRIDGRMLHGTDGCNAGTGTVLIRGALVSFSDVEFTELPCPSGNQDAPSYRGFLAGTASYVITENRLTITRGGHTLGFTAAE